MSCVKMFLPDSDASGAARAHTDVVWVFQQKRAPAVRNPYSWMVAAGSSSANAQLDQMARFLKVLSLSFLRLM